MIETKDLLEEIYQSLDRAGIEGPGEYHEGP